MIHRIDEWNESSQNPITHAPYDEAWVVFALTNSREYQQFVGSRGGCAYMVLFSRYAREDWRLAICDFAEYSQAHEKEILLAVSQEEWLEAQSAYRGHSYRERALREGEPKVLVHSTTPEGYAGILRDGMLKSFNRLARPGKPIGAALGDPKEFSDYIMFGQGGVTGEIVVSSKQRGKIVMDVNAEYTPGARLYFDAAKVAADGLLVRDGCHLKVRDTLPLERYLLFAATPESIGLGKSRSTPKEFAQRADACFQKARNEYGL